MSNTAVLAGIALEAALRLAEYNATLAKAAAEGRDVSDEEVAAAKAKAKAAVDALAATP